MIFVRLTILKSLFLVCSNVLHAQQTVHPITHIAAGARFSKRFSNALDASINPSLSAFISGAQIAAHIEKKFLLDELNMAMIAASIPVNNDGVCVSAKHFGGIDYLERTFTLGYGKTIGMITAGFSIAYINVKVGNEKRASLFQPTVSSIIQVNEELFAALRITNPRFLASKSSNLRAASIYAFGLGYQPAPITYVGFEVSKEDDSSPLITLLLQYVFATRFMFGLSWSVSANQPCVSLSWLPKCIRIETGAAYHPNLGASPFANFILHKQTEEELQ